MAGRRQGQSHDAPPASKDVALAAARAAAEKQGERIVVLDVRELIVITDYFVIASAGSERQARTIVEEVERSLRDLGVKPLRREGESEGIWILLDYVDVVVHVFREEERDFYDLERLWRDAPTVDVDESPEAAARG
ncbi:MAG TPA: ribosome silencing factor [Actinomycetota bacterium]